MFFQLLFMWVLSVSVAGFPEVLQGRAQAYDRRYFILFGEL